MPYDPQRHHRRSIRLRGYDYAQAGAYFVTICTHLRQHLFSNPYLRQIAEEQWVALGHAGSRGACGGRVAIDTFVVMPNHTHGIIIIRDDDGRDEDIQNGDVWDDDGRDGDGWDADVRAQQHDPLGVMPNPQTAAAAPLPDPPPHAGLGTNVVPGSLGAIVRSYKAAVARRINGHIGRRGAAVWQRGYYERIIRDEQALRAIRRYIANNPRRWATQHHNLDALLAKMSLHVPRK